MKGKIGIAMMLIGVLLMLGAAGVLLYQQYEARSAGEASDAVLPQLMAAMNEHQAVPAASPEATLSPSAVWPAEPQGAESALTAAPEESSQPVLPEVEEPANTPAPTMPTVMVQNERYIGTLEIPALELQLPVQANWSYAKLKKTPCHYSGTTETGDLVIIAHNYDRHFGLLPTLEAGETVLLTDAAGTVFVYQAQLLEQLEPNQNDVLTAGQWDLSLSTCTKGGLHRNVLRCTLVEVRQPQGN